MNKRIVISILIIFLLVACGVPVQERQSPIVAPGQSIQACLDTVQPGGTCTVEPGTYNEALIAKTTGTASQRITLQCVTPLGCTVNSGLERSIVFPPGQKGYYTIDGFRFISTRATGDSDATVNFAYGYWGEGHMFEKGNDGFILRNCYVEGNVYIYGANNLVENCEFNGRRVVREGITERSQPSENNIFRNNIIHDYTHRGGWILQMVTNSQWDNNTFYNNGNNGGGEDLDCDGAGIAVGYYPAGQPPVVGCIITNNLFYNNKGEAAILLENGFNSLIENNIIHDAIRAISVINYNVENGDGFHADRDYKGLVTNTIIRNNVIYNISRDALLCKAVRGNQFVNNTIHNVTNTSFFGAVALSGYTSVPCPNWTISNNIISQSPKTIWYEGNPPLAMNDNFYSGIFSVSNIGKNFSQWQGMGFDTQSIQGNPQFVNASAGDFRLTANSPACGYGAIPCGAVAVTPSVTVTRTPTGSPTTIPPSFTPSRTATPSGTAISTLTFTPVPPTLTLIPPTVTRTATFTPSPTVSSTSTPLPPSATASKTKTVTPPVTITPTKTPAPPPALRCDFNRNGRIDTWREWLCVIFS